MKRLLSKFKSPRGASMGAALLLFLVCTIGAAAVVTPVIANAAKTKSAIAEQQKFMELNSALQLAVNAVTEATYTNTFTYAENTIGSPPEEIIYNIVVKKGTYKKQGDTEIAEIPLFNDILFNDSQYIFDQILADSAAVRFKNDAVAMANNPANAAVKVYFQVTYDGGKPIKIDVPKEAGYTAEKYGTEKKALEAYNNAIADKIKYLNKAINPRAELIPTAGEFNVNVKPGKPTADGWSDINPKEVRLNISFKDRTPEGDTPSPKNYKMLITARFLTAPADVPPQLRATLGVVDDGLKLSETVGTLTEGAYEHNASIKWRLESIEKYPN